MLALPDEIWEDIFLRLDAAADLARASAACSIFVVNTIKMNDNILVCHYTLMYTHKHMWELNCIYEVIMSIVVFLFGHMYRWS